MNNMLDTITVGVLIELLISNGIDSKAAIMTDSGWECDETEVDAIYYNPKTNVLMLTRKFGNEQAYADCDDWELLWKHPKYYTEVDL